MRTLILTLIIATLAACSHTAASLEATLRQAESAVARGDMKAATAISRELLGSQNLSNLSATQLSRLSMVYMQMADIDDPTTHTATATRLYRQALQADSDSTRIYFSTLPPEQLQYYSTLSNLAEHLGRPSDISQFPDEHEYLEFNPLDTIAL